VSRLLINQMKNDQKNQRQIIEIGNIDILSHKYIIAHFPGLAPVPQ